MITEEVQQKMGTNYDLQKMSRRLARYLDEDRYTHTQGVRYTAAALAMVHGADMMKAQVAGLLHDCAKCIPAKKKLKLCEQENILMSSYEKKNPFMLHAKLGAYLARAKYDVEDQEILQAIVWHTTGRPNMSLLEKIIFIADYIEPNRCKAPNLEELRKLAFSDLDTCTYRILEDTLEYLESNPKDIDGMTQDAFAYYRNIYERRELEAEEDE